MYASSEPKITLQLQGTIGTLMAASSNAEMSVSVGNLELFAYTGGLWVIISLILSPIGN